MKRIALLFAVGVLATGALSATLYDNGGLVNYPGQGFGGADASALEVVALGENIYGYGHQLSANLWVADDFEVTDPAGWQIDAIDFFAYQTGSSTNSTINDLRLRIWDGVPGVGNVVWGDTTTNVLAGTGWMNAYRCKDDDLTMSVRPIMQNTATVGTVLGPGTYWLDWQTGGTLSSGPWAPPVTILGLTHPAGANGMQSTDGGVTYNPVQDSGSLTPDAFPFIVDGSVVPEPASLLLLGLVALLRRR